MEIIYALILVSIVPIVVLWCLLSDQLNKVKLKNLIIKNPELALLYGSTKCANMNYLDAKKKMREAKAAIDAVKRKLDPYATAEFNNQFMVEIETLKCSYDIIKSEADRLKDGYEMLNRAFWQLLSQISGKSIDKMPSIWYDMLKVREELSYD